MPRIPPTTAIDLSRTDRSPCCDADLVLSSPPDGYECRECTEPYHIGASEGVEVDADESEGETTSDDEKPPTDGEVLSVEGEIERGTCPWCSDYEGDHVGQHASSAHPDEWLAYKGD